jgi:cell division septation protein DedD
MSNRDDDNNQDHPEDQDTQRWSKSENLFSDFDDEADFEDSDRDSDFAAIYTEVEEEEVGEEDSTASSEGAIWELEEEEETPEAETLNDPWEDDPDSDEAPNEPELWDTDPNPAGAFDDEPPELEPEQEQAPEYDYAATGTIDLDPDEDWEELDEYEEEERELTISLGMIVVAILALVLLGAGGYGIVEQRAEMQEKIRQLQSRLATSAPPKEVAASRAAATQASERNVELQRQVEELERENRGLEAIVAGLEKQLVSQQAALQKAPPAAKPAPAPKPAPTATEAKPVQAAPQSSVDNSPPTGWFVNFSSYGKRSTAESWAKKLKTEKGRIIVQTGQSNGRTIYRVRVVDLADRATAETIARSLEREYGLEKLWVGKSS